MKELSNTEAKLEKFVAYKKGVQYGRFNLKVQLLLLFSNQKDLDNI